MLVRHEREDLPAKAVASGRCGSASIIAAQSSCAQSKMSALKPRRSRGRESPVPR
jgi:hypothetical protein